MAFQKDKLNSEKLPQIKAKHLLVENELKNYKHLIQFILDEKVILKKMAHKFILYFSQCTDNLKGLVIIFYLGNLKDYLIKVESLLLHLIILLIQN